MWGKSTGTTAIAIPNAAPPTRPSNAFLSMPPSYRRATVFANYPIARQVGNALESNERRVAIRLIRNDQVHLLREVEKFLRRNDTAPTRFGRDAVGDPRFV